MMKPLLIIVIGILLGLTCCQPNAEKPADKLLSQTAAFVSNRNGNLDIYIMDMETDSVRQLTNSALTEYGLVWAPDGKKLYYTTYNKNVRQIFTIDMDGKNSRAITSDTGYYSLVDVSPDGQLVLVNSNITHAAGELFLMNSDGKLVAQITNNTLFEAGASFSPDGNEIAVSIQIIPGTDDNHAGRAAIFLYGLDGKPKRQLTASAGFDGLPDFSPDGMKIAYHSCYKERCSIFIINLDGTGEENLSKSDLDCRWPRWSPDQQWIYYTRTENGNTDIWRMSPDGKTKEPVITSPKRDEIAVLTYY